MATASGEGCSSDAEAGPSWWDGRSSLSERAPATERTTATGRTSATEQSSAPEPAAPVPLDVDNTEPFVKVRGPGEAAGRVLCTTAPGEPCAARGMPGAVVLPSGSCRQTPG